MKYVGQSWGVRTFADHHCSVLLAGTGETIGRRSVDSVDNRMLKGTQVFVDSI